MVTSAPRDEHRHLSGRFLPSEGSRLSGACREFRGGDDSAAKFAVRARRAELVRSCSISRG